MHLDFEGPEGRLEGVLWDPLTSARAAMVFCHPHPGFGGSMHNSVVYRAARGLQEAGVSVLRFNFRGVGRSAGEVEGTGPGDNSIGADEDLGAALDFLGEQRPGLPLWAGGFSFGARAACRMGGQRRELKRLLLVALPVRAFACPFLAAVQSPTLVLMADEDEFGTRRDLLDQFPSMPGHISVEEIRGADHFFKGQLALLQQKVRDWAASPID
jgi:hypothetical protein